ncbi:MAG: response regulator [bacterium]
MIETALKEDTRILIVDDEQDMIETLLDILEDFGYKVEFANDGPSAINMCRESFFDIIIMDIVMPGINGIEVYKRISKIRPDTKVILMTAYTAPKLIEEAFKSGIYECLSKPFPPNKIIELIKQISLEKEKREIIKKKYKLLLIDDEPGVREAITDILGDDIYEINYAENGKEAIKKLKHNFYNIVIIDINLPDISGLQILQIIKKINKDIYSIILTGAATIESSIMALNHGAYAYIVKPFDIKTIKNTLTRAINEQKLLLENKRLMIELKNSNKELLNAKNEVDQLNKELESKIFERTKQLREQINWTETIIDSLTDGLCTLDQNSRITLFNRQAEAITGFKTDEVLGRHHSEIFNCDPDNKRELLESPLHTGKTVSNIEVSLRNKSQDLIPIRISVAPMKNKKGRIFGLVEIFRDISKEKQLQEQLIQASKLASMGELLANFTHEIKNPLNGMLLFATLIQGEASPDSEIYKHAERILSDGLRIGKIADDILTFSRQSYKENRPVNIIKLIESTLSLAEKQLGLNGIKVKRDFPSLSPMVYVNYGRIQQVFLNLINNAQYALNEKAKKQNKEEELYIKFSVSLINAKDKPYVRIEVEDNGTGVSADDKDKLFHPFFTTKPIGQGTGLGLSVSYGIIKDHDGEILVATEKDKYTRFILDLPAYIKKSNTKTDD